MVVQGRDDARLFSRSLRALDASWIDGSPPSGEEVAFGAKTRYRQADAPCTLAVEGPHDFRLDFGEPQWAVTPGQSAVLYRGEVCLGGGVIA
jgi:tRNA-specific 2-thiouridylase